MDKRIILPLDVYFQVALNIAEQIDPKTVWGVKVNSLITAWGLEAIDTFKGMGFRVMADPKLYDIPSTNQRNLNLLLEAGADIVTVHVGSMWTPGDPEQSNKIAGVTVLTSLNDGMIGYKYQRTFDVYSLVKHYAGMAREYGYGYLVCSAKDLRYINHSAFTTICPGIRPDWYVKEDDQERVMTPGRAIKAGAGLLVIGRPILQAGNIQEAIDRTNEEIENAVKDD